MTLIATGSEVSLAHEARALLEARGIGTALVSLPSFELFRAQPASYRDAVLGPRGSARVGVEAALRFGWDEVLGDAAAFVGMAGYGASAPADVLYRHFGITAQAIADAALSLVEAGP